VRVWLIGMVMFCEPVVGNMEGTLVGGGEDAEVGTSVGIVGIVGIAGMGGMGKQPLNGGRRLNGSGCT